MLTNAEYFLTHYNLNFSEHLVFGSKLWQDKWDGYTETIVCLISGAYRCILSVLAVTQYIEMRI